MLVSTALQIWRITDMKRILLLAALCAVLATDANAQTLGRLQGVGRTSVPTRSFYVSALGNDSNDGRSDTSPWKTLAKVSTSVFQAGDHILLRGGDSFAGTIYLNASSTSSASNPIVVSSYGTGTASINAGSADGINVYNLGGVEIQNLMISGSATPALKERGIFFYNDSQTTLSHIVVNNVTVHGFYGPLSNGVVPGYSGIGVIIASGGTVSKYTDVRLTNIESYNNNVGGVETSAYWTGPFAAIPNIDGVYVSNVSAHDNPGVAGASQVTGDGILISGANNAVIEYNTATNNGLISNWSVGGNYGIWASVGDNVVLQYNESYANGTAGTWDGGGFDLDVAITNSKMQYNYSHNNAGPGFSICGDDTNGGNANNVVRYNISENDVKTKAQGALHMCNLGSTASKVLNAAFYNNTVYIDNTTTGRAFYAQHYTSGTTFRNNILMSAGHALASISSGQISMTMQGNDYWEIGGAFSVLYNGTNYTSLASFRSGASQESLTGSPTGYNVDPLLTAPGTGGTATPSPLTGITAYKLQAGSPMVDAGINLTTLGVSPGPYDFFGSAIPRGGAYDVGANER